MSRPMRDIATQPIPHGNTEDWLREWHPDPCACGHRMTRWESFNGACYRCKSPQGFQTCSCPEKTGRNGWHFDENGAAYERCPLYWASVGRKINPEDPHKLLPARPDDLDDYERSLVG